MKSNGWIEGKTFHTCTPFLHSLPVFTSAPFIHSCVRSFYVHSILHSISVFNFAPMLNSFLSSIVRSFYTPSTLFFALISVFTSAPLLNSILRSISYFTSVPISTIVATILRYLHTCAPFTLLFALQFALPLLQHNFYYLILHL